VAAVDAGFWSGRRVLVTGHTGFKGAWLCTWLLKMGAEVTGFANSVPTTPSLFGLTRLGDHLRDLRGDVCDPDALRTAVAQSRPDVVVHLAAQSLVRASYQDPVETFRTNVLGTVHLLECVRHSADVRTVLIVTSDKCYENKDWPWPYREPEPLGGDDPYSSSKAAAELVTSAYRTSFLRAGGTAVATARAGNVIGGGDWSEDRLLPDVMRAAMNDGPVVLRHPDAIRPWQHVLDCLGGYLVLLQAMEQDASLAGPWNFGPAAEDVLAVGDVVAAALSRWPAKVAVKVDSAAQPHEASRLTLDSSKAREALGWRPRWAAAEAVARTVDWYLACHDGHDVASATDADIDAFASARRIT
jgi:CDP-glucose 4,6-dehydratase